MAVSEPSSDNETGAPMFHASKITFTVLSEESIAGWDLAAVLEACDTGPCVMGATEFEEGKINGKAMANALYEAGSDPSFFNLDDDGNSVDEANAS